MWNLKKRRRGWWWKGIDFQSDEIRTILSHGAFEIIRSVPKLKWSSLESKFVSTIVFVTIVINRYGSMHRAHGRWSSAQSRLSASSFSCLPDVFICLIQMRRPGYLNLSSGYRWSEKKKMVLSRNNGESPRATRFSTLVSWTGFTQGWNLIGA